MANNGAIQQATGRLPADMKKALNDIFDYVLKNWRFGRPGDQAASENFKAVFLEGTTASVANVEFSLEHGLESAPYLLVPVLNLQTVNSELVRLIVTRAADNRRIYLSSTTASAPFTVFVEG
jgi:hypothetical protein